MTRTDFDVATQTSISVVRILNQAGLGHRLIDFENWVYVQPEWLRCRKDMASIHDVIHLLLPKWVVLQKRAMN